MSQTKAGAQAVAAALVGSLASFNLVDILDLLARTERTGELQVVGRDVDKRIWIDRGDLVESASAAPGGGELFELACIEDGWFYFTAAETAPEGAGRTPIGSVIGDLGEQVAEWRSLVEVLPFDNVVKMAAASPGSDVQIRSDQWQLLSLVGSGKSVRDLIDDAPLHPLEAIRTLHELVTAQLVALEEPREASRASESRTEERETATADGTGDKAVAEKGPEFATRLPLPPFTPVSTPASTPVSAEAEAPAAEAAPLEAASETPAEAAPTEAVPAEAAPAEAAAVEAAAVEETAEAPFNPRLPPPPAPPGFSEISVAPVEGEVPAPPSPAEAEGAVPPPPPPPPPETAAEIAPPPPPPPPPVPSDTAVEAGAEPAAVAEGEEGVPAAVMPPPISGDPWSTIGSRSEDQG